MDGEEKGESVAMVTGPTFIKKRTKPRGSVPGGSTLSRTNNEEGDDAGQGEEPTVAVRRTSGITGRGRGLKDSSARRQRPPASSALSFGDDGEEPAFELKKSALAQASRKSKSGGNDFGSLPDSLDQANIAGLSTGYSASALAALKASTPARRRVMEEDGDLDQAHQSMTDPTTQIDEYGNGLARLKFGADFAHDGIPSEALVTAAKERRRRAAEGQEDDMPTGDFISLRDNDGNQSPHPESRLQREEDDLGSGEEEFAEFTGATERVALGQKAIRQAKVREREEKREAMELDDDSDDSGQEWERAQMRKIEGVVSTRKQREKREKSPFKPAPIPLTAPLPTLTSTSAKLANRVAALDSSISSHGQIVGDAIRQLEQLEGDEKRNKADIEIAGEKEAWFREFEEFILSLSSFLEEKLPRLEEVEIEWRKILVQRAEMVGRARATAMTDEACLFHGVPAKSLLPKLKTSSEDQLLAEEDMKPEIDGGALSVVRETRRSATEQYENGLPPAEEEAFEFARKDIVRRINQLLDDVKAPEFLDPAIRIDSKLHPSSLVVRFHQWRALYPDEYASAWGGLTLAGIWDFWIRKELCLWDVTKAGHHSLDDFEWHKEMTRYSAAAAPSRETGMDTDEPMTDLIGGDDEIISHVFCNTLISRIIDVCEAGVFDPWNPYDTRSMTNILEQISYVLERDNLRFQSLVSTFLHTFKSHIDALIDSMTSPPVIAAPPFDPRAPPALLSFVSRLKGLLFNIYSLNKYVPSSERPFYVDLIDRLVGNLIWNLLGQAKDTGGREMAKEILDRSARLSVLQEDVRARLAAMAGGASSR